MYKIDLSTNKTGKCVKEELTKPFPKVEIPANANALGAATIGSNALPGLGVNVVVFSGETGEGDNKTIIQRSNSGHRKTPNKIIEIYTSL